MADTKNPKPLPEGYDPELEKANKGYQKYESEQKEAQKKLEQQDAKVKSFMDKVKSFGGVNPVEKFKKGGKVSSASKRADGCCVKGKTKGKMV